MKRLVLLLKRKQSFLSDYVFFLFGTFSAAHARVPPAQMVMGAWECFVHQPVFGRQDVQADETKLSLCGLIHHNFRKQEH